MQPEQPQQSLPIHDLPTNQAAAPGADSKQAEVAYETIDRATLERLRFHADLLAQVAKGAPVVISVYLEPTGRFQESGLPWLRRWWAWASTLDTSRPWRASTPRCKGVWRTRSPGSRNSLEHRSPLPTAEKVCRACVGLRPRSLGRRTSSTARPRTKGALVSDPTEFFLATAGGGIGVLGHLARHQSG